MRHCLYTVRRFSTIRYDTCEPDAARGVRFHQRVRHRRLLHHKATVDERSRADGAACGRTAARTRTAAHATNRRKYPGCGDAWHRRVHGNGGRASGSKAATQGLAAPRGSTGDQRLHVAAAAVLIAMERAWRGGRVWRLAGHGRAAMLPRSAAVDAAGLAATRRGADLVVFVWTPSHKGVFVNQYADAVADA